MLKNTFTDRAALYGVITKVVQGGAGLITAIFILRFFSPAVQGYYYTFANILALQIFLELGISTVISTFAAHEWAKLSLDREGGITGDHRSLSRLKSLTSKVVRWYAYGSLLLFCLLVFVGLWFFDTGNSVDPVSWKYPWLALCLIASLNFVLTPAWALLSGCGQYLRLNTYRLIETIFRYVVLWSCISMGASLWSAVGALAFSVVAGSIFLLVRYRRFFRALLERNTDGDFDWFTELAPLQFRIAISWISGYFVFSIFVPAMFYFHGAEDAGRMGMTWALVSGLSGVASTWLQVQAPGFSMMVAKGNFGALDAAGWRTLLIGIMVFLMGVGIILSGLFLLEMYRPELANRFISIWPITLFLVAECLHQISMVQSTYLRAFKQEPFLGVSVVSALVIGTGTLWLTPKFGAYGPAVSYLTGVTIGLGWGTFIFVRCRKQWTSPALG